MTLNQMLTVDPKQIKAKRDFETEAAQLDKDIADLEAKKREAIARGDAVGNAEYEAADSTQRRMIARRDYLRSVLMRKWPNVTRAEVLKEWADYADSYNAIIASRLATYQMACRDLAEKFIELAAMQNEAMKVRGGLCEVLEAIGGGFHVLVNVPDPAMAPIKMLDKGDVIYKGWHCSPDVAFFAEHGAIPDRNVSKYDNIVAGAHVNMME